MPAVRCADAAGIALRGVSKTFRDEGGETWALDDISFTVHAGEFVTLIGPSGSGKSTIFNIITGLVQPDAGEVCIGGEPVRERAGRVGYMPQRDLLLPWRTVLDNVIVGPELAGTPRQAARRRARELLPLFGLDGFETAYPATLSGGMRQRAALLRTFLCDRSVILLDEPFGALDALTRRELQRWLLGVWEQFKQTILFITHDVEEAVFLADRVIVLGPRPARVVLEMPVTLKRPRTDIAAFSEEMVRLEARLMAALEGNNNNPVD
ncbi:MAG: ABC transporter ATP-binding protein [Anaerolineae bacterium]|nr:ABC transporter ATP-binding protein [Anaerolineae bacterium]